jgi:20S proteasome subunit beta 7
MTGSTVMAVTFEGGVAVASDRSVFYGKMERMQEQTRQFRLNPYCMVVFSGDFADFQWLQNLLERKQLELQRGDRKQYLKPEMVHGFLTSLFYQRRSKMNPIWNTVVVCGIKI